jgi:hypothetical protein
MTIIPKHKDTVRAAKLDDAIRDERRGEDGTDANLAILGEEWRFAPVVEEQEWSVEPPIRSKNPTLVLF